MRMISKGLVTAVAGTAATLAMAAAPAFAASPTGNEAITSPSSPYTPAVTSTNNPNDSAIVINGSGYAPGANIFAIVCDGKAITSAGWSVPNDCDNETQPASVAATANGTITFNGANSNFRVGVFRGESPADDFNCLAPDDNPNGPMTSDGSKDPVDGSSPSWGSTQGASSAGGGTASCQIVVYYQGTGSSFQTADKVITLNLASAGAPAPATPESPLPILLPIGGVALIGLGAGVTLRRRRRSADAA